MLENPALIYQGPKPTPWQPKSPAPLILLHDGGGTTFNYHCLYPIGRTLYGIQNSHLDEGGYWDSGVSGMAAHWYIKLIESVLPKGGDILLGGWSFGGHLSLEVAWQMLNQPTNSTRPKYRVLGMVFIDSICPKEIFEDRNKHVISDEPVLKSPEELKDMVLRDKVFLNMANARAMIKRWKMPDWNSRLSEIPPTIMLRAKEFVGDGTEVVDHHRDSRFLGWDRYLDDGGAWIKDIVDLDGHHFNIFDGEYLKDITAKIAAAANELDVQDLDL
ncbi:alpha/beta-hydrolase [Xylariaceae sp. FL1019]|nr:alpha/beta-hydrolase [Xylariaceae sp. FL1019]